MAYICVKSVVAVTQIYMKFKGYQSTKNMKMTNQFSKLIQ